MKKQYTIITVALLGLALGACHKKEEAAAPQAPAASVETQMRSAYGFAAQIPSNVESYAGFYNLGKLVGDIKQSKTWASIKANPLFGDVFNSPGYIESTGDLSSNPEAAKWKAILKDAFGNETFVALMPGSGAKLHVWLEFNSAMRAANIQQALATAGGGRSDPTAVLKTMLPFAKDLDIPPMIIGFKVPAQKAALEAEITKGVQNLPPFFETGTFDVGGKPFKSIAITVSKALPPIQQVQLKMIIATYMPDQQKADETVKALLARRLEIAYGYVGDYFIMSIGPDHSQLKFAATYGDSLLSRPDAQPAANYTGKPVLSFSWTSAEMAAACQEQFQFMGIYEEIKQDLSRMLAPNDVSKLETDLKRLDDEGKVLFNREYTPMLAVIYRENGLHGEMYGGVKDKSAPPAMKFSQVPNDSTFIWADQVSDQVASEAIRVWFEDICTTSYDTFSRVGLPLMSPQEQMQFSMFQTMAVPKITELYRITRDQFAKSLGLESAVAMDLSGEIPALPAVPAEFHTGGRMVRLAYLSDVSDRALLAKSWDSYFKLAGDIAQMTPAAMMFADGLPAPLNEVVDGVSLSYYKAPMDTGDLLLNVAVTDKTFVLGTSRSYSLDLSKAMAKSAGKPVKLDFRMNMKPAYDFLDKWLTLAGEYPGLFFKDDESEMVQFKKSQPSIAQLLQTLRAFDGISVQAYDENGVPRVSSVIRFIEK